MCIPWPSEGLRRASVASFGFGGSNSHAVLDDAYNYMHSRGLKGAHRTTLSPSNAFQARIEPSNVCMCSTTSYPFRCLLVLSAADEDGVQRLADAYQVHFKTNHPIKRDRLYLHHLAYTLSSRRSHLPWKSFALVDSTKCLEDLPSLLSKPIVSELQQSGVAFVFTGQGAQYRNMGAELLAHPTFETTIKLFDKELALLGCSWTVAALLREEDTLCDIDEPEYSQPMTTALQIALYELLRVINLKPTIVIGHSSGEIAAAYASGALSLGSACRISYYRGKCTSLLKRSSSLAGAMLSVDLGADQARDFISKNVRDHGTIHIACINSPCNVTLSGDEESIDLLIVDFDAGNIRARKLRTGVAYHSPHMAKVAVEYAEYIAHIERGRNTRQSPYMISSVTGKLVQKLEDLCTSAYWVSNMVCPVEFLKAMSTMSSFMGKKQTRKLGSPKIDLIQDIIEVGPHSALRRPIRDCLEHSAPQANVRYDATIIRDSPAGEVMLKLAGQLYSRGYPIDIEKINEINPLPIDTQHVLVDLPSYPFNHSKIYWQESAYSRHSRLRRAPKKELLGVPVPEWNPLEPKWRKFFDLGEMPWIDDHKVNGRAIYPATGMVVMAIEGVTQIADPSQHISGYQLSDVIFSAPIHVGEGKVEVQLHMRPGQSYPEKNASSFEFRIHSRIDENWIHNCHGSIQVLYDSQDETSWQKESLFYSQRYKEYRQACNLNVATNKMYKNFVSNGLNYGPAFQALDNLSWDGAHRGVGDIKCFQWTKEHSQHTRQNHVAHPVTLDSAGQLSWIALTRGAEDVMRHGLAVTRIRKAWIASSGLSYPDTNYLRAACTSTFKGLRGTDSSIFALDAEDNLKILISHLETTAIGGDEQLFTTTPQRQSCFGMAYKPDINLLDANQLAIMTRPDPDSVAEPRTFYENLEAALFALAAQTLKDVESFDLQASNTKPHIVKYVEWLNVQVRRHSGHSTSCNEEPRDMQRLIESVDNGDGELLVHVGSHLSSIIRGLSDPLELLFRNSHAERYYEALCDKMGCCKQLVKYLDLLSHKQPHLTILEVGAGTGSFTGHVLRALSNRPESLSRYDYTDISEAFFERAREKFSTFGPRIAYRKLNIEEDPGDQGYRIESYDVVVAALVLHATSDLAATIRNTRRLLKPQGKLIILEITEPSKFRTGFAFGTLPGWWLSTEKEREWSPCVSAAHWGDLLRANGFQGVDITFRDYEDDICHESSILIATADHAVSPANATADMTLLVNTQSVLQTTVAESLRTDLKEQHGLPGGIMSIQDLALSRLNSTLVFLVELDRPYLSKLDSVSFEGLRTLLSAALNVIWVTSSERTANMWADLQMVRGLSRVLNTEKPSRTFVTLSLADHSTEPNAYMRHICQAVLATVVRQSDTCELEYVEDGGVLTTNRVFESDALNQEVHSKTRTMTRHRQLGLSPPLTLTIANPGIIDSIRFEEDETYYTNLGANEVEIKVAAVGINFRDLFVILGKLDSKTVGCDCAGVVTRIGAGYHTVKVGDRVCAAIMGCCNTYARCDSQLVVKLPDDMSLVEAASLPVPGVTAYYSLHTLARLQKGESILIHCAAGGTGQMVLQLAQLIGAEVYVTVGTKEKRQLMRKVYGIPETHIFYSRDSSFARDIYRATNGRGVDVVVNSLSGQGLLASWECIAPCGRFIELGKSDIQGNTRLPMSRFDKNVAFYAIAVDYLSDKRPSIVGEALRSIIDMVSEKRIKIASPLHLFPISKIEEAFRLMQSGKNTGKMVLTFSSSDVVPVS